MTLPFSTAAWKAVKWFLPKWEHSECIVLFHSFGRLPGLLFLSLIRASTLLGAIRHAAYCCLPLGFLTHQELPIWAVNYHKNEMGMKRLSDGSHP